VFYQIWSQPLLSVIADHVISDALALCGGENVMQAMPARMVRPGREAVLHVNPDAIVVAAAAGAAPAAIAEWQRWASLRAVRSAHVFAVDPVLLHRHTPRVLDGATQLCLQLEAVRKLASL
jgi:iron complex transport system substrate-binding protein